MPDSSRTLIVDYWAKQMYSPLCLSYSIIRCRLAGMGGFASGGVNAVELDKHFLLMSSESLTYSIAQPFGIVDLDQPDVALDKMYREAKRIAASTAEADENQVLDLTSRIKTVRRVDSFYVPDRLIHKFAVR